jgi:hypothetical protein
VKGPSPQSGRKPPQGKVLIFERLAHKKIAWAPPIRPLSCMLCLAYAAIVVAATGTVITRGAGSIGHTDSSGRISAPGTGPEFIPSNPMRLKFGRECLIVLIKVCYASDIDDPFCFVCISGTQLPKMFVRCSYTDSFSGGYYGGKEKNQKACSQIMVERGSSPVEGSLEG